jgi:hypothetical protein
MEFRPNVHKRQYNFTVNPDKYQKFLADHLLELNPTFYGVKAKQSIDTIDGEMRIVHLIDETADPSIEVIAECFINGQNVYLWNDQCWLNAVTNNGDPIVRICKTTEVGAKVIVLYLIGDV